jgi:hypothetical protein
MTRVLLVTMCSIVALRRARQWRRVAAVTLIAVLSVL